MRSLKIGLQRGISNIPVIIFIAISLISLFIAYTLYVDWQDTAQKTQRYKVWAEETKSRTAKDLSTHYRYITSLTGFFVGSEEGGQEIKVDIKKLVDKLNRLNSEEDKEGTKKYYNLNLIGESIRTDKLTEIDYPVKLDTAIDAFLRRLEEINREKDVIEHHIKAKSVDSKKRDEDGLLVIHLESEKKEYQNRMDAKEAILSRLKTEYTKLKEKFDTMFAKVEQETNDAKTAKQDEEKKREKLEQDIREQKIQYNNKISKAKSKIRELQAMKYGRKVGSEDTKPPKYYNAGEANPKGEIVFADYRAKVAYINLGKKSGVIKGTKFDVYRKSKGGTRELKGSVEVREILDDTTSGVTILSTINDLDPIVPGDTLVNPFFSKDKTICVALAGNLKQIDKEKVKEFLEKLGSKLEPKINAQTNIVIVGSDNYKDDENYKNALELGLELITEENLLRYIGY